MAGPFDKNDHGDWRMEPTARGDMKADLLRRYYEANRDGWWRRHFGMCPPNRGDVADELMLGMMQETRRIDNLSDDALCAECNKD